MASLVISPSFDSTFQGVTKACTAEYVCQVLARSEKGRLAASINWAIVKLGYPKIPEIGMLYSTPKKNDLLSQDILDMFFHIISRISIFLRRSIPYMMYIYIYMMCVYIYDYTIYIYIYFLSLMIK